MFAALGLHPYFEASCVVSLIALAMRNQLTLRIILLLSYTLLIIGNIIDAHGLRGEYIVWNSIFFLINLYVMIELIYGRTTFGLSAEEKQLYALMGGLTPGDFRKLIHLVRWKTAERETAMTAEGVVPDRLYFVYEGMITVCKAGHEQPLDPRTFIGEIAFLKRTAASASVRVAPQSRWVEWPVPALRHQLDRDEALRTVLVRLIGEDLAQKLARA